jgi:hypothetical protein
MPIRLEAGRFDEENKILALTGFELQYIQPENLVTVQTKLPRLLSSRVSYDSNLPATRVERFLLDLEKKT